jgi:hypothetical protein
VELIMTRFTKIDGFDRFLFREVFLHHLTPVP